MAEKKKQRSAGMKRPDNFEELEKEFESVLNELLTDESLERFRKEYEKLHEALLNSHESERRLMNKVRELNEEISSNADKVATAVRLSKEDEATITNLTQETEKAWKLVEYLQDKEVWSRETITTLRQEIEHLKALVERSADLAIQFQTEELGGPSVSSSPTSPSAKLRAGTADKQQPAGEDNKKVEDLQKIIAEMEQEDSRLKGDIYQTQIDLRNRTLELQRERSRRAKADGDVTNLESDLVKKDEVIQEKERNINSLKDNMAQLEVTNKELSITTERCIKEVETLTASLQKVQTEYEKTFTSFENLQLEHLTLVNDATLKSEKLSMMTDLNKKLTKAKSSLERKVKTLTEQRHGLRVEKEQMLGQLSLKEKTIEADRKQKEMDEKRITNLMRERNVFNKNLIKQVHITEKQANLVSLAEQTNRNMGQEIMGFHVEAEKQRRIILQMERERDRFINENGELTLKVMKGVEDIQMRDLRILDYQKQVDELESRLKIQQNMYEAVHQDKNMYSRLLVETQDEMGETKNQLRILEHQSNQLKEEVANREAAVVKEHMECLRLEKERDSLIAEIQMLKNQLREVEQIIKDLRTEEQNLQKVIAASDEIIKRQKRELDNIISERDILGSQLVRRNDELSLLYQKTKLLQILIENGNRMYNQRIEDIRLLRLEVKRQRNQNRCLQKSCENVASYKQELYSIHREVLHERARCAALEIELSHPRQIHRWRGIEITDPSKFELLQKVQAMQKRLINCTEEVVEVERVVQEKDRLYLQLRAVLERQPGPEVAIQISAYQSALKQKNKQLKCVLAELNMYKTDTEINKYDAERLESKYVDMKMKYFKEKKRRYDLNEYKTLQKRGIPRIIPGKDHFTGGGFKVIQKF